MGFFEDTALKIMQVKGRENLLAFVWRLKLTNSYNTPFKFQFFNLRGFFSVDFVFLLSNVCINQ